VLSLCNYNKNFFRKELFEYLLTILPSTALYAYSKKDLKFKREAPAREAIQKGNFLYYNKKLTTELIFDIDDIKGLVIWDLDWIYKTFYEKFNIPLTWICKTDKGVQFCISLNTFYKLSKKQLKVLKDFKQYIIDNWALIDPAGSKRLKGWWRNPLKKEFRFYGNRITFNEILDFLKRNNLTIQQQFKADIRKKQIRQTENSLHTKIRFTIGEPVKGNRNNWIFYNLMLNTNSKNLDTIIALAKELNKRIKEQLEDKELLKIANNVWNYNKKDKNYIYSNSKKANWNIGSMGFEKISNLPYEEYIKEVKRRQKMAGKEKAEIGTKNLIQAVNKKAQEAKEKVYKAIEQLKKENKRISALAITKISGVSRNTATKYFKQAKNEGLI